MRLTPSAYMRREFFSHSSTLTHMTTRWRQIYKEAMMSTRIFKNMWDPAYRFESLCTVSLFQVIYKYRRYLLLFHWIREIFGSTEFSCEVKSFVCIFRVEFIQDVKVFKTFCICQMDQQSLKNFTKISRIFLRIWKKVLYLSRIF